MLAKPESWDTAGEYIALRVDATQTICRAQVSRNGRSGLWSWDRAHYKKWVHVWKFVPPMTARVGSEFGSTVLRAKA
jgi:hypothetical protein